MEKWRSATMWVAAREFVLHNSTMSMSFAFSDLENAVAMADQLGVSPLESSNSSLEWSGGPRFGVDAVVRL
jgi:hypothetical protein